MNKLAATLLGASLALPLAGAPALAAPQHGHAPTAKSQTRHGAPAPAKYVKKAKASPKSYKSFRKGDRFDQAHARNYQIVDYKRFRKLPAPKRGYRYVRAGNDVLLIGTSSYKVFQVYGGVFR
ncbi:MAG: RcnB family protein [Pseudomonadota bacterium]|nr:RcnB family protein [Pseudomonadota bacterium]